MGGGGGETRWGAVAVVKEYSGGVGEEGRGSWWTPGWTAGRGMGSGERFWMWDMCANGSISVATAFSLPFAVALWQTYKNK